MTIDASDINHDTYSKAIDSIDFRKLLVKMVKAAGQEVIDRAEDLVGNGDLISDFEICLGFPTDGRMLSGCPTIDVSKSYCSKKCFDVLMEKDEGETK